MKSRSIVSGVRAACDLIVSDWKSHGSAPQEMPPPPSDAYTSPSQESDRPRSQRAPETPTAPLAQKSSELTSVAPKTSTLVSSITSGSDMRAGTPNSVSSQSLAGADAFGLTVRNSDQGGAEIVRIVPDSSASIAGLHVGDVIVSVGGKRVRTVADLSTLLNNRPSRLSVRVSYMFHTNLGWMPGPEKVLTLEALGN